MSGTGSEPQEDGKGVPTMGCVLQERYNNNHDKIIVFTQRGLRLWQLSSILTAGPLLQTKLRIKPRVLAEWLICYSTLWIAVGTPPWSAFGILLI